MALTRHGEGRVLWGCADFYPGQTLTWTLCGRPDLQALAGKFVATVNGLVRVSDAPPPPGIRYYEARVS